MNYHEHGNKFLESVIKVKRFSIRRSLLFAIFQLQYSFWFSIVTYSLFCSIIVYCPVKKDESRNDNDISEFEWHGWERLFAQISMKLFWVFYENCFDSNFWHTLKVPCTHLQLFAQYCQTRKYSLLTKIFCVTKGTFSIIKSTSLQFCLGRLPRGLWTNRIPKLAGITYYTKNLKPGKYFVSTLKTQTFISA